MSYTSIGGSGKRAQRKRMERAEAWLTERRVLPKRPKPRWEHSAFSLPNVRTKMGPNGRPMGAYPMSKGPKQETNGTVKSTAVAFNPVTDRSADALADGPMLRVLPGDRKPGQWAKGAQKMSPERRADLHAREIMMRLRAERTS